MPEGLAVFTLPSIIADAYVPRSKGVVIDNKMAVRLELGVVLEHLPSTPSLVEFWTIFDNPAFRTWP